MGRIKKEKDDRYAPTEIFRMCAYRGIPYEVVINSPYSKERGIASPNHSKTSYPEGLKGTRGWGADTEQISDLLRDGNPKIPPFSKEEMLEFLGIKK